MTCIAWDGKTLAADKRGTTEYGLINETTKIFRHAGHLVALSGSEAAALETFEWWKRGASPADFPSSAREGKSTLVVINSKGVQVYTKGPYPEQRTGRYFACGSGGDFALGAMAAGKSAREAVEIANEYCAWCGNGVDVLEPTWTVTSPTLSVVR